MINNYKIIISNEHNLKYYKFDNKNFLNENNNLLCSTNFYCQKFIIILLLFIVINLEIKLIKSNKPGKYSLDKIQYSLKKEKNVTNSKRNVFRNFTFLKNEMHSYGLYNTFKNPKISLILMNNEKLKKNKYKILNFIKNLTLQNISDIEIILYTDYENKTDFNLYTKELKILMKNNIFNIYIKRKNIKKDYSNLINLINGFYTIFINNINLLKYIHIQQILRYSKNEINKYLYFHILNKTVIYFMKTKLLKDFIDNGIEFSSIKNILEKIEYTHEVEFNYIPISLCPNNRFTNLAYVAMTSILSSKARNTYICFYLIIPNDFENKNINFIKSLKEEYDNFNITFIRMDNKYDKAYTDRRISAQAYYRFSLGELLKNINKIIYLDVDVIVYKDLSNFYYLNFNGKMILGQPTYGNKNSQKKGFHKVNTGILLLNLFEMRKFKIEEKVIKIIKKGKKLSYHDQTLLNDNFKQYIGIFPPEYHARPWSNYKEIEIFNNQIGKVFDQDYFYFANKYPTIRHFLGRYKPKNPNINYIEDWWFFARKSKYYVHNSKTHDTAFSYKNI